MDKLEWLLGAVLSLQWEWGTLVLGDDARLAQVLNVLEPWHSRTMSSRPILFGASKLRW
jgi:hypothetical protein